MTERQGAYRFDYSPAFACTGDHKGIAKQDRLQGSRGPGSLLQQVVLEDDEDAVSSEILLSPWWVLSRIYPTL